FFSALCPYSIILLFDKYKVSTGYKREQLKFLAFAFSIALIAGGIHVLSAYFPVEIIPHDLLLIVWCATVVYSISKYRYLDIKITLVKSSLLIIIYCLVLGIPFFIGFSTNMWFIASLLLFGFSTAGPIFFRYLQRKAEKILLAEQQKYQQFLVQASKGMVEQHDLTKLANLIVRMIKKAVRIQFVSLFIYDEHRNIYYNIANRGLKEGLRPIEYSKNSKIIRYICKEKQPIMFLSLKEDLKNEIVSLSDGVNLIVPSILREELVAFLILGDKINKSTYSSQDIEVFKTLSNQAGLAIENCYFLEKSKKQQERLFEAEKLASIGGMADGMAHQIKNRLHQFSMVGGELRMEVENFENNYKSFVCKEPKVEEMVRYLKEISDSIGVNVKKTNNVLQGILNFAKTTEKDTYFSFFSLKEIVEQSLELVKVKHQKDNIPLVLELPEGEKLYGVKSQVQEVIFNCIDNSVEAISEKEEHLTNSLLSDFKDEKNNINFNPEIKITLQYVNKSARIYIKDNGIGIKTENQPKIFSAFFTTKPSSRSGSGIGSYVVKRMIVENHKGDISFRSQYGIGTTFVINLPMSKNVQEVEILSN
ncbi:MAG: ATP-binding protein, partial [Endomicrobiaceae bacterium]|nr:ATP-binding protein [Endomicrobiaceae bacterium]